MFIHKEMRISSYLSKSHLCSFLLDFIVIPSLEKFFGSKTYFIT
jgi:hypothetical protein